MDEAKALVNNNENQITIPLKTSMPNITTNQIGTEAFSRFTWQHTLQHFLQKWK